MSVTIAPQEYPDAVSPTTSARDRCNAQPQGSSTYDVDDEYSVLESLLTELPQHTLPNFDEDKFYNMPEGSKESGWQQCLKAVEKHDSDLCQAYREQIDTLLVFAGLFSAIVTAFAVESYQWLLDDPADTSAELLRDITRLLAQNLNQTTLPARPTAARLSDGAVARINVFWFSSLSLSLSAALVGILCKQWLREYERDVGQGPETALGVRHIRYQGLSYWKVGSIVNSVPILLQVSLALFLTGIVELLWRANFTVAIFVTVISGITLAFYMSTTLLPLIQYTYIILRLCGQPSPKIEEYEMDTAFTEPQCAFKSAQAWIALRGLQPIIEYLIERFCCTFLALQDDKSPLVLRPADSWISFDINWMRRRDHIHWGGKSAYETLGWIAETLDEKHLSSSIWHCVWARWMQTRIDREDQVPAVLDLGCVARVFPEPIHLDIGTKANIRVQAAVFRCSLRTTLSIDTAIEMILRIAPEIGVDSRWTAEALRTVSVVYVNVPIRLSNDMAVGLFRLAKLQTQAIIRRQSTASDSEGSPTHWQGTAAFFEVFQFLLQAPTDNRKRLLPAMCALALQWLRAHPGRISIHKPRNSNADFAEGIAQCMITYYAYLKCDPARLHEYPGIIFPARLTAMVVYLSPDFGDPATEYWCSILNALVRISHANALTIADFGSRAQPTAAPPAPVRDATREASLSAPTLHTHRVLSVREENNEHSHVTSGTVAMPASRELPAPSRTALVRGGTGEASLSEPAPHTGPGVPARNGNGGYSLSARRDHIAIQLDEVADLNHAASPQDSPISTEP